MDMSFGISSNVLVAGETGTGKTYMAFQIIWRLWKSGLKKRILSPIAIVLPPNDLLIIYIIQIRLVYVKDTKTKKFNIFSKTT